MSPLLFHGGADALARPAARLQRAPECERQWTVNGKHPAPHQEDWLVLADQRRKEVLPF
ncbi:MAG: hypothetical protein U1G05_03450 [Kiritimatiellia bacterium]